jgi:UDP-3-O-[3-hydroxymyristoyl] glucosamine N-acyltransferase
MSKGYTVKQLAELTGLNFQGNPDLFITGVSTLDKAEPDKLAFLIEEKYFKELENTRSVCFLVDKSYKLGNNFTYLISHSPRLSMTKLLELFTPDYEKFNGIHPLAFISENVSFSENVSINHFVYIGKNSVIGKNVTILPGCYIGENSVIGDDTFMYPNVTILANSLIGKKAIIHSGTVIGSDGYGFIQLENNFHYKVPQVGNVIIEDDVEIGANVSIDRGTIGSTKIGEGSKIDNQVHIAHNVEIGKRSLIVAQVGIAGSTKIGSDVIIAGQAGIAGHLRIGDKTMVLGRSGVTKDFPENSKVSGFPARDHKEEIKNRVHLKQIPALLKHIEDLQGRVSALESLLINSNNNC